MVTEPLRDQLQRILGNAYSLDRELGGGGMSRVFLALETALGRDVVVKIPGFATLHRDPRWARLVRQYRGR